MAATGNEVVLLKQLKAYGDTKLDAPKASGTDGQMLVYGSDGNQWIDVPEGDVSGFITETEADAAYAAKSHTHTAATSSAPGFMSAADKTKLDGLKNYTLPAATTTALGGVKIVSDIDFNSYMGITA